MRSRRERGTDAAFQAWLQSVWPQAQEHGVSRATFDTATRGLEPDLSLPELVIPGRPEQAAPGQPEFVQTPADYLKEPTFARLAAEGRKLYDRYRAPLTAIEQQFGVPPAVLLAIFGRETDYGRARDFPQRDPRAGDAGLSRQAQGKIPRRIRARAQDA